MNGPGDDGPFVKLNDGVPLVAVGGEELHATREAATTSVRAHVAKRCDVLIRPPSVTGDEQLTQAYGLVYLRSKLASASGARRATKGEIFRSAGSADIDRIDIGNQFSECDGGAIAQEERGDKRGRRGSAGSWSTVVGCTVRALDLG